VPPVSPPNSAHHLYGSPAFAGPLRTVAQATAPRNDVKLRISFSFVSLPRIQRCIQELARFDIGPWAIEMG